MNFLPIFLILALQGAAVDTGGKRAPVSVSAPSRDASTDSLIVALEVRNDLLEELFHNQEARFHDLTLTVIGVVFTVLLVFWFFTYWPLIQRSNKKITSFGRRLKATESRLDMVPSKGHIRKLWTYSEYSTVNTSKLDEHLRFALATLDKLDKSNLAFTIDAALDLVEKSRVQLPLDSIFPILQFVLDDRNPYRLGDDLLEKYSELHKRAIELSRSL